MRIFWICAAVFAVLCAAYLFLIFPRPGARRRFGLFADRVWAHRGEFDNREIPENSLPAFARAVKRGVGIELDIHRTADGEVVVIHDSELSRLCGVEGVVEEMTAAQLGELTLLGTGERIPTLREVLALVGDRVPLIVELKGESADTRLCDAALPILENSGVTYCVESFNPLLVARWRRLAPHVMRGVLTTKFRRDGERRGVLGFVLGACLMNFLARPDFIACRHPYGGTPTVQLCRALGALTFAWTIRTRAEYDGCRRRFDAFICENVPQLLKEKPE